MYFWNWTRTIFDFSTPLISLLWQEKMLLIINRQFEMIKVAVVPHQPQTQNEKVSSPSLTTEYPPFTLAPILSGGFFCSRHKIISIQAALSQQQNKPPLPLVIISLDITSWLVAITGSQRGWIVGVQSTRLPAIDKNATWRGRDTQHPGTQIHLLLANTYTVTFPNGPHWAQHCVENYVTFLSLGLHFFLFSNVSLTHLSKRNR